MIPFKLNNEIALIPINDLVKLLSRNIVCMELIMKEFKDIDYSKQIQECKDTLEELSKHKTE